MKSFRALLPLLLLCPAWSADEPAPDTAPRFGQWGFDMEGRDVAVKPGDDFFEYSNGRALEKMEIPADMTSYGAFTALAVLAEQRVKGILEEAAAKPEGEYQKIGFWYKAAMDEQAAEERGIEPIEGQLAAIRHCGDRDQLARLPGAANWIGRGLFGRSIGPDAKQPERYAVYVGTGGLALPDKGYYVEEKFAEVRAKYRDHIERILSMIGWEDPEAHAEGILQWETELARMSWDRTRLRNRDELYHPMSPAELEDLAPGYDLKGWLEAAQLGGLKRLVVSDKEVFGPKAKLFSETPLELLQAWLAFGVADSAAPWLSRAFAEEHFEFWSRTLAGQPEPLPRWKQAVGSTNGALGEEVGKVYVKRYFSPEAKTAMLELVENVRVAMGERIDALAWMGPETKAAAHDKLAKFRVKIGYPEEFRDFSGLEVKPDDLFGNFRRSRDFEWRRQLRRLNEPVDRAEWWMNPQRVNAYYSSTMNEIVFPAAILQPPFFDPQADPAVNYGGIGGVIGHEISHGFDDQGRKSDGDGVLRDWWTEEDAQRFKERADKLVAQYDAYEPLPGEPINGRLTLGENIGDLGGLNIALAAYLKSLKGAASPVLDGTTGIQRVFYSWAQIWQSKMRDDALRQLIHSNPHSPAPWRVNGIVRNMDAWYEAFGVEPGDKLYLAPAERVKIW